MGCYPNKTNPPKYILVERQSIDDEPTVEDFNYTVFAKVKEHLQYTGYLGTERGAFSAVYELKDARYVDVTVLDLEGKSYV